MKIVFLERTTVTAGDMDLSPFEAIGEVEYCESYNQEKMRDAARDADVLILNKTVVDSAFFDACPKLKCICLLATGYNNIDLAAAREHGVAVCNVPGYSTDAVSQLVFGFFLQLAVSLPQYEKSVRDGVWCASNRYTYLSWSITELAGKTLGIVGYGEIGRRVARIGEAFGMKILVHTRTVREDGLASFGTLEEVLQNADFLSLHCPLTEETKGMIGRRELAMMKPTAYLVNTSRGAVVDEQALADALNSGRLAGAGIDVLEAEPMSVSCPYRTAKNCLVTPHIAWAAKEARARLLAEVAENIRAFQNGEKRNRVESRCMP